MSHYFLSFDCVILENWMHIPVSRVDNLLDWLEDVSNEENQ